MSRVPKWKVEKAKMKVVFRLQFHATHIQQPGWDKLFVSFIPVDTGKATAKTTKANVRNGNCKWSDPIYETTRLLQDIRSRKYDEKLYKLVVAMGSSRSSLLGEVAINLADFADASKPSSVSLPLHGCDYGTVLHVTIQLLTSKTGFREFEQQRELSVKGLQTLSGQRSYAPAETATATLEMTSEQLDKVNNARVRFKEDSTGLPSLEEVGESNEDYEDSAAGLDGSSNTSESLYAEKNEISSMHEVDSLKSMASGDINALPAAQSPRIAKHEIRDIRISKQGSNDWTHGWSSDYSADNDLTTAYEENNRLRVRLEGVEAAFLQLKTEAKSLQNLSDELGAETHNLAKQLAVELASGEKLTAEVSILKSECYKFKKELEELKSAAAMHCIHGNKTPFHGTMKLQAADVLSTEQNSFSNQHQVKWPQGLLLLEDKIREIQNKACLRYHCNDFDSLSSDFDVLQCILDNVRRETSSELVEETQFKEMQLTRVLQSEHFIHRQGMEGSYVDHHHHPDGMLHSSINSHPLKKNIDATSVLEEKMCELLQKLEESDVEKGILTKKMDQMECYYEALIQELEESRHQVANEFENLKTEHSSCLYTISALQSQVEKLQQDMNEQFIRFAGDRHDLDSLNKELEEKAIASETALKRVRLNYAIAVDRLQKDLELLSFQVLSMYETNENLAKQALMDASQLFPHQNPEIHPDEQYKPGIAKFHSETISRRIDHEKSLMVNGISDQASLGTIHNFDFNRENKNIFQRGLSRNVDLCTKDEGSKCSNVLKVENIERSLQLKSAEEEKDLVFCNEQRNGLQGESPIFEAKYDFQSQNVESSNPLLGDNVGSEETGSSVDMLQKLQVDTETEFSQMHMLNMHWEVFTEVLKEAIHSLNDGVTHMKEEMVKLARQLKDATSEKELLMLNLQSALDDVRKLRKDEANCRSKCDDLMSKNHILEARIGDVSRENSSFAQKVAEYQNKYKSCLEEKNEFEDMLKTECLQTISLRNEIRSTVEDFKALKEGFDNQSSANSELQKTINYLQMKLGDLCHNVVSFGEEIDGIAIDGLSLKQEMESNNYMAIVLHLEQFQQEAYKKILQLHQEKKEIEEDRDITHCSLNNTEAQILNLKQRFESDLEETRMKLDFSDALVEKLKRELQDVADKLKSSLESEERHKSTNKELSSKLAILEIEIQQANDEKRDITKKLLEFDNVKDELERTKLSLMDCMQENRALMVSIESGKVVSIQLENELINLKEGLKCAHDNLHVERGSREELEATIADLTLQLEDKGRQLLSCVEQKSELIFLRQRVTDLETEMQQLLLNSKECQRILDDDISTLHLQTADLEYYLAEFLDQSLSADVKVTYLRCQCQLMMEELVDQNKAVHGELEELHLKHTDLVASLKAHIAIEAQFAGENARLSTALQSVKAELEAIVHEKEGLLGYINEKSSVLAGFEDMEARVVMLEADNSREKKRYEDEICQLRNMVVSLEEEVDSLRSSKVELETTEIILKSKLDEQLSRISLLEECEHELTRSREQHTELTYKLSEQSLKTEEFKNLSIHLRELKDKADAECLQARERREAEGSSLATQDSLRIAFIKEQCESKLQEMKNQLCASNKYAEEMLLKLQTALDEVETGKRSEASLAKRNEELSVKISDMEAELQTVVTDRRELVKALDRMKAELECTILSLDCCKEEKLKLEASLQECSEERTRLRVELDLVKRLLENMASFTGNVEEHKNQPGCHSTTSIGEILEDDNFRPSVYQEMPNAVASADEGAVMGADEDPINDINRVKLGEMNPMLSLSREAKDVPPACGSGNSLPTLQQNLPDHQDELVTRSSIDKETLLENSTKHIADIKEHFKEQQRLLTSMDLLHKELERLKNDNLSSVIPLENHYLDPALQGLQSDFSQLDEANEHLGSIFPTFKEIPGTGNPLERVLALELELADSLQAKKKDIRFQSSFLKQHNDDEAVFKSFRDINDLIQDMLELKRRNAAVETELKEMQGRYSQLSLQFAEVEGERQQLVMTLKNRSPRQS